MSVAAGLSVAAAEKITAAAGEAAMGINPAMQQLAVANQLSAQTLSPEALQSRCLDFQTGKLSPDELLRPENPIPTQENVIAETQNTVEDGQLSRLTTRNEALEGETHPDTGVPFVRRTVVDADGNKINGVFPEFESKFDAKLPEDKLQSSDSEQFTECNKQLKDAIDNDPELAKKFNSEQLEQIENGETPDGYTWHHHEDVGKMKLVDSDIHAHTGHTGGKSIWGGGIENR